MMFDRQEYIAAFSKVTASERLQQEVMNMTNRRKENTGITGRRMAVLATAVVLLMAITVTAFAAEDIASWFRSFFAGRSDAPLSQQQLDYLCEYEQPIGQSLTQDGWTVELLSAIHDESAGYLLFRVMAPEGIPLEPDTDNDGGNVIFGNFSRMSFQRNRPDLLKASEGIVFGNWGFQWTEDGDGKDNTRSFVIHLSPSKLASRMDPFGSEAEYYVHIENIVRETVDEQLRKQLQLKKEKEKTDTRLTDAELALVYQQEVLAEGIWEFTVSFADPGSARTESVELLSEPIGADCILADFNDGQMEERIGRLQLYSIEMRPLSVTFRYGACIGAPDMYMAVTITNSDGSGFVPRESERISPCVVLKDGSEIRLLYNGFGSNESLTMEAESPIVFEEVSHLRLADGTIVPMPESE